MARKLIGLDEARRIVIESCAPLPAEPVPLEPAWVGRLAEQITSDVAIPPFDNSAMDGFALRAEDTAAAVPDKPVRLRSRTSPGPVVQPASAVGPGEAFRIATGAMVPEGADAILRQEDASELDGESRRSSESRPAADIRPVGEDVRPGQASWRPALRWGPPSSASSHRSGGTRSRAAGGPA